MKTLKLLFILLLLVLLYPFYLALPASLSDEKVRIVIPIDFNQDDIIKKLKIDRFIRSEGLLNFILGVKKYPGNLEPGAYMISRRMTVWQLADVLLFHPYQKWVTLVPGLRREQVAEKLAKKFNWDKTTASEFLEYAQEGYLFPDTYLLNVDYSGKDYAQRLKTNFHEKFDATLQNDLLKQDIRNDTAVKIASLIERESGGDDDKSLISGIIWNRLNNGMKLQIDAATQYALGTEKDWWPRVSGRDMKFDSPYNTYLYKGLPPAPISNPSLASIKAVVYPLETDCLYYIHDLAKRIHCSKTYEDHLENIDKYLK